MQVGKLPWMAAFSSAMLAHVVVMAAMSWPSSPRRSDPAAAVRVELSLAAAEPGIVAPAVANAGGVAFAAAADASALPPGEAAVPLARPSTAAAIEAMPVRTVAAVSVDTVPPPPSKPLANVDPPATANASALPPDEAAIPLATRPSTAPAIEAMPVRTVAAAGVDTAPPPPSKPPANADPPAAADAPTLPPGEAADSGPPGLVVSRDAGFVVTATMPPEAARVVRAAPVRTTAELEVTATVPVRTTRLVLPAVEAEESVAIVSTESMPTGSVEAAAVEAVPPPVSEAPADAGPMDVELRGLSDEAVELELAMEEPGGIRPASASEVAAGVSAHATGPRLRLTATIGPTSARAVEAPPEADLVATPPIAAQAVRPERRAPIAGVRPPNPGRTSQVALREAKIDPGPEAVRTLAVGSPVVDAGNAPARRKPTASAAGVTAGVGRAGAAEAPSGAEGASGMRADYELRLRRRLEMYKEYPRRARFRGQEGTASLYLVVARDGRLRDYRIERTSGHSLLDRAALAMAERAQPLPKIPDVMERETLILVVPIEFSLR